MSLLNGTTTRVISSPGNTERYNIYFEANWTLVILNESNTGYFTETTSMNLISYEEVKFIGAEAENRTGDSVDVAGFNTVRTLLAAEYTYADVAMNVVSLSSDINHGFDEISL